MVKVTDRLGHDLRQAIAFAKIKALGFTPGDTFERSLAKELLVNIEITKGGGRELTVHLSSGLMSDQATGT